MNKKTKAQVKIFGNKYTLVGNESYEYINKVANDVDKKMHEIARNPALKPIKVSVLAAVNFCDECHKISGALEEARLDAQKYKTELEDLKSEIAVLKEERRFLKEEIKALRKSGKNE